MEDNEIQDLLNDITLVLTSEVIKVQNELIKLPDLEDN